MDGKELVRASSDYADWDPVSIFGGDEEHLPEENTFNNVDALDSLDEGGFNANDIVSGAGEDDDVLADTLEQSQPLYNNTDSPRDNHFVAYLANGEVGVLVNNEVEEDSIDEAEVCEQQQSHDSRSSEPNEADAPVEEEDMNEQIVEEHEQQQQHYSVKDGDIPHQQEQHEEVYHHQQQEQQREEKDPQEETQQLQEEEEEGEVYQYRNDNHYQELEEVVERQQQQEEVEDDRMMNSGHSNAENEVSADDNNDEESLRSEDPDSPRDASDNEEADSLNGSHDAITPDALKVRKNASDVEDERSDDKNLDETAGDNALQETQNAFDNNRSCDNNSCDGADDDSLRDDDDIKHDRKDADDDSLHESNDDIDRDDDVDSLDEDDASPQHTVPLIDESEYAVTLQKVYRGYKGRKLAAKAELHRGRELMRAKSSRQKSRPPPVVTEAPVAVPKQEKQEALPEVSKSLPKPNVDSKPTPASDDDADDVMVHKAVRKTNVPESPAKFHTTRRRIESTEKFSSTNGQSASTVLPKQYTDLSSDIQAIEMMLSAHDEDAHSDIDEIALTNNDEDEIERDSMSSIHEILDIHKREHVTPPSSAPSAYPKPVSRVPHKDPIASNAGSIKVHSNLAALMEDDPVSKSTPKQPPSIKDLQNISSGPIARVPRTHKPAIISQAPVLNTLEAETPRDNPPPKPLPIDGILLEPPRTKVELNAVDGEGYSHNYVANAHKQPSVGKPRGINKSLQARRAAAAMLLQRVYRGHRGRKRAALARAKHAEMYACGNCGMLEQGGVYCKRCGRRTKHKGAKPKRRQPVQQPMQPVQNTTPREVLQAASAKYRADPSPRMADVQPMPPADRSRSNPRRNAPRDDSSSIASGKEQPKQLHKYVKDTDPRTLHRNRGADVRAVEDVSHSSALRSDKNARFKDKDDDAVPKKETVISEAKSAIVHDGEPAPERKPTLLDDVPRAVEGGGYLDLYQKKRHPLVSDAQSVRVASSPVYNPYEESNSLPAIHEKRQRKNPHGRLHATKSAPSRYRDETSGDGLRLPAPVRKSHDYDDLQKPAVALLRQKNSDRYVKYNRKKSL